MRHLIEKGEFQEMKSTTGCFPDKVPSTHDTFIQGCFNVGPPGGAMADPECARGGGVSHILSEKGLLASFTFFRKMHENAICKMQYRAITT